MTQFQPLSNAEQMLELLAHWRSLDVLRPIDCALANGLNEMASRQGISLSPMTLFMSALCSKYLSEGHVCIDLKALFAAPSHYLSFPSSETSEYPDLSTLLCSTDLSQILKQLQDCDGVMGKDGHENTNMADKEAPLAIKHQRVYLSKYYHYESLIEREVAQRLQPITNLSTLQASHVPLLKHILSILFEREDLALSGSQKVACAIGARSQFAIITGGPGTGKTTTVVKLLATLQALAGKEKHHIVLAAPTGKAAARLSQSLGESVDQLPLASLPGEVSKQDIPTEVNTLHRVLGSRAHSRLFKHNEHNKLPADVIVIDEASMVDVSLMAALLKALKPTARLILLGDKDQLASVDAGAVLGQLAKHADAKHYSKATCEWLEYITGVAYTVSSTESHSQSNRALTQNLATLTHSFRFDAASGIGRLAKMLNDGRVDQRLINDFLHAKLIDAAWIIDDVRTFNDVAMTNFQTPHNTLLESAFVQHGMHGSAEQFYGNGKGRKVHNKDIAPPVGHSNYLAILEAQSKGLTKDSPDAAWDGLANRVLAEFERFQLLCAMRSGPFGVKAVNTLMERCLIPASVLQTEGSFYQGRPVLVTRNDYALGLRNGDIGIVIKRWANTATANAVNTENMEHITDSKQNNQAQRTLTTRVAFPSDLEKGGIRWFSPSRLQHVETVFAMTVHKSQGSEFEHACVILPDDINPIVTRELIYTAVTRAKHWVSLLTPNQSILSKASKNPIRRESGLEI